MLSKRRLDFPATVRLKRRADFQRVYREGVRVTGRHLVVFLMRADGYEGRLGVTASRRVGGAVVRARCKRRLRELYRIHRHEFRSVPVDMVLNAHRSCAAAPWRELEQEFLVSIQRGIEKEVRTPRQPLKARPD